MINLRYTIAFFALCCPAPAWAANAHDFFPNCAPLSGASGQTLIVDPSGNQKGAYPTIAAAQKIAKPGDKIDLMTGDYGEVIVDGRNSDFITLESAPGQSPKIAHFVVGWHGGASRWRFMGLNIMGVGGRGPNGNIVRRALVTMNNSDNIIFEHNNVYSQAGDFNWQSEITGPQDAPVTSDGIGIDQVSCISLNDNRVSNVFNAISVGGDQNGDHGKYIVVSGNLIDNFAGDGIDHSASHLRILNNRITNSHDICENKCVHTDGIQGWTWHNKPGLTNTDVVIDGNAIIVQTKPGLAWPADDMHGITIFDGRWDGMQISNNLVVTDTWHGITANRVENLSIINNTVVGLSTKRRTWIAYGTDKSDPPDTVYHVIVRNNVAPDLPGNRGLPRGVVMDHNLRVKDPGDFADIFVKFDPEHFIYDLHPTKRSDARGEGSAEGAPAMDIEGQPRKGKIDLGAYAYQGN